MFKEPKNCTISVCKKDAWTNYEGKPYCHMHYRRLKNTGSAYLDGSLKQKRKGICSASGCNKIHQAKGLCKMHWIRQRRHGDIDFVHFDMIEKENILYKIFNCDNEIIYIGITIDFQSRIKDHKYTKDWWSEVSYIRKTKYKNRFKVLEAEKRAIKKYNPVFNIQHNKKAA